MDYLRLFGFLLCTSISAAINFPDSWVGKWGGQVQLEAQSIFMTLEIKKTDETRYEWIIQYAGEPKRSYELLVKDKARGRYVIDEKNQILIDQIYENDTLTSAFTVNNRLIVFQYQMIAEGIRINAPLFSDRPTVVSGPQELPVASFRMVSRQNGLLRKLNDQLQ